MRSRRPPAERGTRKPDWGLLLKSIKENLLLWWCSPVSPGKPPRHNANLSASIVCPKCHRIGDTWETSIVWASVRYLLYTCGACGHSWSVRDGREDR